MGTGSCDSDAPDVSASSAGSRRPQAGRASERSCLCSLQVRWRPWGARGPGPPLTCPTTLHGLHASSSCCCRGRRCCHRHGHSHGHCGCPPGEAEPGAGPVWHGEAAAPALERGQSGSYSVPRVHKALRGREKAWGPGCLRQRRKVPVRVGPDSAPSSLSRWGPARLSAASSYSTGAPAGPAA